MLLRTLRRDWPPMAMPAGVRIKLVERAGVSPHGQAARAGTRGTVHEEALIGILQVVACHMITDAADFFAQVVVQDLKAYERLLTEKLLVLDMIEDIRSNFFPPAHQV